MDATGKFRDYLKRKQLRDTAERRSILLEIKALRTHFTIDDLQDRFRRKRRPVSRATLYRTLGHLVESGLVRKLDLGQREAVYEFTFDHEHHEHMICLNCGKVIEFADPEMERLQEQACRARRFRPVRHFLQILGYCRSCK
jgi:Fur family ferric uptake transcriptional regulator